jgi:UTP-glucose-1-phosphate uridylyltransferase
MQMKVVEEAIVSGITDFLTITGRNQLRIKNLFNRSLYLKLTIFTADSGRHFF